MGLPAAGNGEQFIKIAHPLILISIPIGIQEVPHVYEAVRFAWKVDVNRVRNYALVLAHDRKTVLGAFRPREWLPADNPAFAGCKNFLGIDQRRRYGFVGDVAEAAVRSVYEGKMVPAKFLTQNPIRYCDPDQW